MAPLRTHWFSCKFHKGDSVTSDVNNDNNIRIDTTPTPAHCIAECSRRSEMNGKINGVTVSNDRESKCWCVVGIIDINALAPNDQDYSTCYLKSKWIVALLNVGDRPF